MPLAVSLIISLYSTECILFIPAGFRMSRGYSSWMIGHFRLWPPSGMHYVAHLASISCWINPMPDKMNLDCLNLLYCEFQKYEVMTMTY